MKKEKDTAVSTEVEAVKTENKPVKKAAGTKKENWFKRTGKAIGRKCKEIFQELKKVTWPKFGVMLKQTGVVFAVCLFFLVILTAFDFGLSALLELIVSL